MILCEASDIEFSQLRISRACIKLLCIPEAPRKWFNSRISDHGGSSSSTSKHASWLNMIEIEIGVLRGQCLARRIDDPKRLRREITA